MAILPWPRRQKEPAPNWDKEHEALGAILQWLSTLDSKEQMFRVLTVCMWRLKSGDEPAKIRDWVDSIAEQSTEIVGGQTGFGETKHGQ